MRKIKRRLCKVVIFGVLVLFLHVARILVEAIDKEYHADTSHVHLNKTGIKDSQISQGNADILRNRPKHLDTALNSNGGNNYIENRLNTEAIGSPIHIVNISAKDMGNINTDTKPSLDQRRPDVTVSDNKPGKKQGVEYNQRISLETRQQERATRDVVEYVVDDVLVDEDVTYPPFVEYSPPDGPGEWGHKFTFNRTSAEIEFKAQSQTRNSFDQVVSDHISVHRRLADDRTDECKRRIYKDDLPAASIIICFHNEAWSTLLRSVHSVLDRSPSHLVREVILVDDASTLDHLQSPLRKYMSKLKKVKILRMKHHQGLIRARLAGYDVAKGPVLVFLDSHIECFPGWLEPLLHRVSEDRRAVPYPHIHPISSASFSTGISNTVYNLGVFDWKLMLFNWAHIVKSRMKNATHPISSPTMPGGLFAIDRSWFSTIGTYDPGLAYYGGENIELSFKTWMCNGSIELHPCSHVGHVFRTSNPIRWSGGGNPLLDNAFRVAEVWMDQYKHIVFEQTGALPNMEIARAVRDRKRLRESLNCHDFRWYLENVYPECDIKTSLRAGEIRSEDYPSLCIDAGGIPKVASCHGIGGNQYWLLDRTGGLYHRSEKMLCIKGGKLFRERKFKRDTCSWTYRDDNTFYLTFYKKCLTLLNGTTLDVRPCSGKQNQKWKMNISNFQANQ